MPYFYLTSMDLPTVDFENKVFSGEVTMRFQFGGGYISEDEVALFVKRMNDYWKDHARDGIAIDKFDPAKWFDLKK